MSVTTSCQCTEPGHCERHRCEKNKHWLHLCQTRNDYFQLWEEGRGPGQHISRPHNPAVSVPCQHQGAEHRVVTCPTCKGNVRLKVFDCSVHKECTIATSWEKIACCTTCEDYQAIEKSQISENS